MYQQGPSQVSLVSWREREVGDRVSLELQLILLYMYIHPINANCASRAHRTAHMLALSAYQ